MSLPRKADGCISSQDRRAAPTFRRERGSARTWLLALAHHRAIDLVRRNAGRPRLAMPLDNMPSPVCSGADPWEAVDRRILREHLRGALARLSAATGRRRSRPGRTCRWGRRRGDCGSDCGRSSRASPTWHRRSLRRRERAGRHTMGCVRTGTTVVLKGGRWRHQSGSTCRQAAARSVMMAAPPFWNKHRRSARAMCSPHRVTPRKYWRCSSKAGQQRAADATLPNPRLG